MVHGRKSAIRAAYGTSRSAPSDALPKVSMRSYANFKINSQSFKRLRTRHFMDQVPADRQAPVSVLPFLMAPW